MRTPKKRAKAGISTRPRGIKLPRKLKFEPTIETDSGVKVRSQYEKRCADFLFRNQIKFQYEPLMLLGGRKYRPDFFLPDHNLFLEICGYNHMPYYRDRTEQKRKIYERNSLNAIFIHYNGTGSIENIIKSELQKYGVIGFPDT
ncbi:MAG: hypothetical protein CO189_01490 [candidate division Zixibacteria bacterium CG_4_9_14_3_um_filter_46_8]|nr:MAG: hypothetical protein CO189_01490 [candidate division Zixibacteria bacterium CG_4_9_14_3_um_filter_46_8]